MPSPLRHAATLLFALSSLAGACPAQEPATTPTVHLTGGVAATPPLGWSSRDSYGPSITEAQFRANVAVLRDKLKPFGWQYAILDASWFVENPHSTPATKLIYALDDYGRYVPVPERFPSAVRQPARAIHSQGSRLQSYGTATVTYPDASFAALGASVHDQGLKFGLRLVRGIPRASVERNLPIAQSAFHAQEAADTADLCPGDPGNFGVRDNAAGQAWYDALLGRYADWGVDFVEVGCLADNPYKLSEIQQIRRAIDRTGRPMVLSLSPGPTQLTHAEGIATLANMWSLSDGVQDRWAPDSHQLPKSPQSLLGQFPIVAAWAPFAQPGDWPDAGTLPLGELKPSPGDGQPRASGLTPAEQRTMVTLWAIARSPLIVGANLTLLDAPTLALLTNRDVLRVNGTAVRSAPVVQRSDLLAWRADLPGGEKAIALFNLGATDSTPTVPLSLFGADLAHRDWSVREVWAGGAAISGHEFLERIPAHGAVLLLLN